MSRKLDLNLLLALDALLIERNVTRAAARLKTSQPALSAQLVRLRAMFDDPLLLPGSRGMTPTPRALELAPRISMLISEFKAIVQPDLFDPKTAELTVKIACPDAILPTMAPSFAKWTAAAPGIKVGFMPLSLLSTQDIDSRLATGELDILVSLRSVMPERTHVRQVITESFVCAIRRDHPFRKRVMSIDDLCSMQHIIISPTGGGFSGETDVALARMGKSRSVVASIPSFMLAEQILQTSDFAAVLPRTMAINLSGSLRCYELPVTIPTGQIFVGWHERTHHSPAHRWFREQIYDAYESHKKGAEPTEGPLGSLIRLPK